MKRILASLIVICSLGLASAALGADGVKFGYVDIQKVLINSDAGKAAKEQLAAKANKYETEKNSREEELKKLKAELEKQNVLLSESSRSAKEKDYQLKLKEYQRFMKDAQDDLQAKNDELTNKIVEGVVKLIQNYGRNNGYTMVFVKNDSMIYVDEKSDLTDQILKAFNAAKK